MAQLQRLVIEEIQRQGNLISLASSQQHYLRRVLRLGENDSFIALNGQGKGWIAKLAGENAIIVEPVPESTQELGVEITLITSVPKNGFDDVVRCCTELGVAHIIPVLSDRTVIKPSDNKLERWRKIAKEATEQAERQWIPTLDAIIPFPEALGESDKKEAAKYICVARGDAPHLLDSLPSPVPSEVIIATGCEGGWTAQEIEQATEVGFQPVSLGNRILRAVTAPIVALSLVTAKVESKNS